MSTGVVWIPRSMLIFAIVADFDRGGSLCGPMHGVLRMLTASVAAVHRAMAPSAGVVSGTLVSCCGDHLPQELVNGGRR